MNSNGITIAKIEAEHFLMISKLDYVPRKGMNIFVGENAQGKTDMLRLIQATLKGAGAKVIQHGKDKASLMVSLSNGDTIKRNIRQKSGSIKVTTAEGDIKATPQAYLDSLLGDTDLLLDPVMFVQQTPKVQQEIIKSTFGVGQLTVEMLEGIVDGETLKRVDLKKDGFSVLKEFESIYYTKRTGINTQATQKQALINGQTKQIEGFDNSKYDSDASLALKRKVEIARESLTLARQIKEQAETNQILINTTQEKIDRAEKEMGLLDVSEIERASEYEMSIKATEKIIRDAQAVLLNLHDKLNSAKQAESSKYRLMTDIDNYKETIKVVSIENVPDTDTIENELFKVETEYKVALALDDTAEAFDICEGIKAEYQGLKAEADNITTVLGKLRKDLPGKLVSGADLPFESLSFEGEDILFNGTRLSLMSTKEQLMTILGIFNERNKNAKFKLIFADGIECLDAASYKEFWEFVNKNGYQAFCTKVLTAPIPEQDSVTIEGGEIKT